MKQEMGNDKILFLIALFFVRFIFYITNFLNTPLCGVCSVPKPCTWTLISIQHFSARPFSCGFIKCSETTANGVTFFFQNPRNCFLGLDDMYMLGLLGN